MKANPQTIEALFNSQLRYVVPMFQRLYVWQENPQWQALWEDLVEKAELQLAGTSSSPHYLGALIIEGVRPGSPREVKRFLVIDGQQRLTTLQLLLCSFRDVARKKDWKTLDRTSSRYLENVDTDVMEHPEEERFKLWPTTLNREVFRDIILAGSRAKIEDKYPLIWKSRRKKPEPRSALVDAYVYFSSKIEGWVKTAAEASGKSEEECAFALLQALQQDFSVVEISLSEGDDSQEIFYSLNSQGRPLSQSDLLRSLIFMRAEKEKLDRDKIFADYWSKFETVFWSTEIKRGGRTYSRLDLALRFFLIAKTGTMIDARRVNEEYRRWIAQKPPKYASVRDELADFTRLATAYQQLDEPVVQPLHPTDLRRILADLDVSTAIPVILSLQLYAGLSPGELTRCLSMLESFIIRRALVGSETKEYNKFFVEVIDAIRNVQGNEVAPALARKLSAGIGSTRNWPTDAEVVEEVIRRPIGSQMKGPALRLILERLELSLRTKKAEETAVAAGLQVEHVMPQSWSANWPLKGKTIPPFVVSYPYVAKDELTGMAEDIRRRNDALQTLGNLTLLNQYLNPAVSNGSFDAKKGEYRNSVLQLNRFFDKQEVWNEESIAARGRILGEQFCKVWPRPSAAT